MNTSVYAYKGLLWSIGIATLFALLSLAFILFHAERGPMQIVGKVSSVSEQQIVIVNARGYTTTLVPKPNTPNPLQSSTLTPGMFVQAFGTRIAPNTFEVEHVQILKDPINKP
jgi:hypothetical protein